MSAGCVHELFEEQADRTPDAIAVVTDGAELTYGELEDRANRLAGWLRSRGVGPESLVAVHVERSLELIVAIYGALKAGAAYLPLEPSLPPLRLRSLLDAARPSAVLTREAILEAVACGDPGRCPGGARPDNLAYVIHTSGSTGRPRGVMNVHGALRNRLRWMQEALALTPADRVLHKTPIGFDVSVWELFWPLLTGATMVVARPEGHRDPGYLVRLIQDEAITTAHFVPAMLSVFLDEPGVEGCASLRRVVCSGEALTPELQARFFARSGARLFNLYGPTEAAIDVTWWACERGVPPRRVPIGHPIANTRIHLLDPALGPVTPGRTGELCIGGIGLARGYLGQPGLTAERFVPDPIGAPGGRVYRTGDLAGQRPDGAIEFLGRIDDQVKIRGFRVELEEIRQTLEGHPAIRDCVVVMSEGSLAAYVVPADEAPAPGEVRAHLRERLPEHMVPADLVFLSELPLTPSGKVDRRALPSPRPNIGRLVEQRQREAMRQLFRWRGERGG